MAHEGLSTQATIAPLCPRTRALAQPASQPGIPTLPSTLVIPVCGPKGPSLGRPVWLVQGRVSCKASQLPGGRKANLVAPCWSGKALSLKTCA